MTSLKDTGTTLILIASNAFETYLKQTGGVLDQNTGLVRLTTTQFNKLQNLNFDIGGVSVTSCDHKCQLLAIN